MLLTKQALLTPQIAADKQSVKELIEFERYCRDNALWDQMYTCFHPESNVNISWFSGKGKDFVDASKAMEGRAPHKIYSTQVWLKDNKAVAIMQATIQKRLFIEGNEYELNSDAKLLFRSVKEDDEWLIYSLECIYEQDSIVSVIPGLQSPIKTEDLSKYRDSYKCLSYVLESSGYIVNPYLAGLDSPDLVSRVYEKLDDWLCS